MPPRAKTVSLEEIADAFGVTTESIRLWRKDGMPSRQEGGRPRFVLRECIEWRREADRQAVEADAEDGPKASVERALKLRVERKLREVELAEKLRQLVPIGESVAFIEEFVAALAATAAGRLQRFERDIVRAATPAAARRVTTAIHVALMEGGQEFAGGLERAAVAGDESAEPTPAKRTTTKKRPRAAAATAKKRPRAGKRAPTPKRPASRRGSAKPPGDA